MSSDELIIFKDPKNQPVGAIPEIDKVIELEGKKEKKLNLSKGNLHGHVVEPHNSDSKNCTVEKTKSQKTSHL